MSYKQLVIIAEKFQKLAETPQVSQADIGSGEAVAISSACGAQIKQILSPLAGKAAYIQFAATVTCAPNFAAKAVNLDTVEVYAGFDEPQASLASAANEKIMMMKPAIEAALMRFYRTPAGLAILKVSGAPPSIKAVFKWKLI